jgi:Domain of unknown function (DUF3303)
MRVMARISIPADQGNEAVRTGTLPKVMKETAERWHPEGMYFTTFDGRRTAYIVFDMADPSVMPQFAEPFFREMNADVALSPVMDTEDLQKGLAQLG